MFVEIGGGSTSATPGDSTSRGMHTARAEKPSATRVRGPGQQAWGGEVHRISARNVRFR